MNKKGVMTIGEVAQRTGSSVSALRFYADQGLIASTRSNSGHRLFARAVIRRVSFILIAQNLGYTLSDISNVLKSLPDASVAGQLYRLRLLILKKLSFV